MRRRDDDYVDGAELDDSDELVEDESDDSDEFHALPSLPNAPCLLYTSDAADE